MTEEQQADPGAAPDDGWEWAIVELFGHRSHAGRAREEERFGAKMLRIDIPTKGDPAAHGWTTRYYGGSAMFSYTPTDEVTVMKANKPYEPASLTRYRPEDEDDREFHQDDGESV